MEILFYTENLKVINNTEINRVQLIFPENPAEEIVKDLKRHGWRWSQKSSAWQRQNTENGLADAKRIQDIWFPGAHIPRNSVTDSAPVQPEEPVDITPPDIEELKSNLKTALVETADPLPIIDFTRDNYENLFPRSRIETPIENVKIEAHQFEKLEAKNRQRLLGAVYETLALPDIVINEERKNIFGEQEQVHSYLKSYIINEKTRAVQSVVVSIEDDNVSISTHERDINNAVNKIKTPDQLLFAAAKVGRVIERMAENQAVTVNRTGVSEYVRPLNLNYHVNSILSIKEMLANGKLRNEQAEKELQEDVFDSISSETEIKELQNAFQAALEETAVHLTEIELSQKNYTTLFARNSIETPVESVKLGNNQFEKLRKSDRDYLLAAAYETLAKPSIVLEKETLDEKTGDFRPIHVYGKSFYRENSDKTRAVESVIIFRDGLNISIGTHNKEISRFVKQIKTADDIIYADKEVSRVAEQHTQDNLGQSVDSHVRLDGINTEVLNKRYTASSILSIKELISKGLLTERNDFRIKTLKDVEQFFKSNYTEADNKELLLETQAHTDASEGSKEFEEALLKEAVIREIEGMFFAEYGADAPESFDILAAETAEDVLAGRYAQLEDLITSFQEQESIHNKSAARLAGYIYENEPADITYFVDFINNRYPRFELTEESGKLIVDAQHENGYILRITNNKIYRATIELEGFGHEEEYSFSDALQTAIERNKEMLEDIKKEIAEDGKTVTEYKNSEWYEDELEYGDDSISSLVESTEEKLESYKKELASLQEKEKLLEDITKNYAFVPTVGEDGIIDYTGVQADKIYLTNKKDILDQDLPSYLPPVNIRRREHYDIPSVKIGENEYLLKGSLEGERRNDIYRVTLDVYAALINYHLEYDRAAFKAIAQQNEKLQHEAQKLGQPYFDKIDEHDIPKIPCKLDVNRLRRRAHTNTRLYKNKPSRVVMQSSKSNRMYYESYYFIRDHLKESKYNIFLHHRSCLADVQQKLLDMELQKADWETSWSKGRETAYGDSNTDMQLIDRFGVPVKRQNGDAISNEEKEQLTKVLSAVYSVYGDLSNQAIKFGLKVSHAGNTKMHASKAVGLFSPYQKAIGISFAKGNSEATWTASHEFAHFIDHIMGQKQHTWHTSDIQGSLANRIASRFRNNMLPAKGNYWNRTCECFARAMEEYSKIFLLKEQNPAISNEQLNSAVYAPGYMEYGSFCEYIMPLAAEFIEKSRTELNLHPSKMQHENVVNRSEVWQNESVNKSISNPALQGQLELFEGTSDYNSVQHDFFRQLDAYLENGVRPKNDEFILNTTPDILQYAGVPAREISIRTSIINKAVRVHNLTKGEIRTAVKQLADPVLVFKSDPERSKNTENGILMFTDTFTKESKPIAFALDTESAVSRSRQKIIVNEIRSVHGRTLIAKNGTNILEEWTNKGLLKYYDDKKISNWQRAAGVYFSLAALQSDNQTLSENTGSVKTKTGYLNFIIAEHPDKYLTTGDPSLTRDQIRESKAAARTYCDPVLRGSKNGLWKSFRDFRKHGVFDITGKAVDTDSAGNITEDGWQQLSQALRIYRDKRFETFRYLFVTPDGTVKDQLAISARLPNITYANIPEKQILEHVISHAERTGTKIVLVHNHPSGNTIPSIQDIHTTKELERMFTRNDGRCLLQGHVILDHDTFGLYERGSDWAQDTGSVTGRDELKKTRQPDFTNIEITGEYALEKAARSINNTDRWNCTDWIPVMFVNTGRNISSIKYYHKEWFEEKESEAIVKEFRGIATKTGAVWAFPIVPDEMASDMQFKTVIQDHMKQGCFKDYYMDGHTALKDMMINYSTGIFDTYNTESAHERAAVEATFDISREPDYLDTTAIKTIGIERNLAADTEQVSMPARIRLHEIPEKLCSIKEITTNTPNPAFSILSPKFYQAAYFFPPMELKNNEIKIYCKASDFTEQGKSRIKKSNVNSESIELILNQKQAACLIDFAIKRASLHQKNNDMKSNKIIVAQRDKMSKIFDAEIKHRKPHSTLEERKEGYTTLYGIIERELKELRSVSKENNKEVSHAKKRKENIEY